MFKAERLKWIAIGSLIVLVEGCSVFEHNTHPQYHDITHYGTSYDHGDSTDYPDTATTYQRNHNQIDDEKPVQMTPKDSHLQAVSPTKQTDKANNNSNVLLPLNSEDLK